VQLFYIYIYIYIHTHIWSSYFEKCIYIYIYIYMYMLFYKFTDMKHTNLIFNILIEML